MPALPSNTTPAAFINAQLSAYLVNVTSLTLDDVEKVLTEKKMFEKENEDKLLKFVSACLLASATQRIPATKYISDDADTLEFIKSNFQLKQEGASQRQRYELKFGALTLVGNALHLMKGSESLQIIATNRSARYGGASSIWHLNVQPAGMSVERWNIVSQAKTKTSMDRAQRFADKIGAHLKLEAIVPASR